MREAQDEHELRDEREENKLKRKEKMREQVNQKYIIVVLMPDQGCCFLRLEMTRVKISLVSRLARSPRPAHAVMQANLK